MKPGFSLLEEQTVARLTAVGYSVWGFARLNKLCILIIVRVTKAKERHLAEVKIIKFDVLGENT